MQRKPARSAAQLGGPGQQGAGRGGERRPYLAPRARLGAYLAATPGNGPGRYTTASSVAGLGRPGPAARTGSVGESTSSGTWGAACLPACLVPDRPEDGPRVSRKNESFA